MKGKLQAKAKEILKSITRKKSKAEAPKKEKGKMTSKLKAASKSKKATSKREKTNPAVKVKAARKGPVPSDLSQKDPAHSPGHRKMNIKDKFAPTSGTKTITQNQSAMNNMARNNRIERTSATNRRIITGAAIGKSGRVTIKE